MQVLVLCGGHTPTLVDPSTALRTGCAACQRLRGMGRRNEEQEPRPSPEKRNTVYAA